jgi:hypothetical protein
MRIKGVLLAVCGSGILLANAQDALAQRRVIEVKPLPETRAPGFNTRPDRDYGSERVGESPSSSYSGSTGAGAALSFDHSLITPAESARRQWHYGRAGHF